ncbi:hypothetical protein TWF481_010292 [Arthrobotrys musiformis]|uniref:DNA2/NAM7 helicase helicase domain-containing protein n=1 Tax=Arthrobotrys musiformis TaxID=47236 RepID=A0AAV9W290_9PEZI
MERRILSESALVFATTNSSQSYGVTAHFLPDVVFMDEAGQLSEIDICVAPAHSKASKVILSGDQMQLPSINTYSIPFFQVSGLEKLANLVGADNKAPNEVHGTEGDVEDPVGHYSGVTTAQRHC